MSWHRLRERDDTGAALPLVLAFLTLFSVLITVLLMFAWTSFKSYAAIQKQGKENYAVDGAVEQALTFLKDQTDLTACPPVTGADLPESSGVGENVNEHDRLYVKCTYLGAEP